MLLYTIKPHICCCMPVLDMDSGTGVCVCIVPVPSDSMSLELGEGDSVLVWKPVVGTSPFKLKSR